MIPPLTQNTPNHSKNRWSINVLVWGVLRACVGSKTVFWDIFGACGHPRTHPKTTFCPKTRDLDIYSFWKNCGIISHVPRTNCKRFWPRHWGRNVFHLFSTAEPRTSTCKKYKENWKYIFYRRSIIIIYWRSIKLSNKNYISFMYYF